MVLDPHRARLLISKLLLAKDIRKEHSQFLQQEFPARNIFLLV